MIWTGPLEDQRSTREGRGLQIKKHTDGTYRLLVWKTPTGSGSAIVGIFSAPEVARVAAEKIPLDDASLSKLIRDPHAAMKERWKRSPADCMGEDDCIGEDGDQSGSPCGRASQRQSEIMEPAASGARSLA